MFHALDIGARHRRIAGNLQLLLKALERLRPAMLATPTPLSSGGVSPGGRIRLYAPAVALRRAVLHALALLRRHQVPPATGVLLRRECVEIDELGNLVARAISNAGCDHAAVAVPHQHEVVEFFRLDDAEHVADMRIEIVRWIGEMLAFAQPRVARREKTGAPPPPSAAVLFSTPRLTTTPHAPIRLLPRYPPRLSLF